MKIIYKKDIYQLIELLKNFSFCLIFHLFFISLLLNKLIYFIIIINNKILITKAL